MKVCYTRVSTLLQNSDRQKIDDKNYDLVVEDKCSGSIPFFERDGGKTIKKLIDQGLLKALHVHQLDRLGRSLKDILYTIEYFTQRKISINITEQGLCTLDENGNESPNTKLFINLLGCISELERSLIRNRAMDGIILAKARGGVFTGRKAGTKDDVQKFLSKPKNALAVNYLKKKYKAVEISKLVGIHVNTITKIKKLAFIN